MICHFVRFVASNAITINKLRDHIITKLTIPFRQRNKLSDNWNLTETQTEEWGDL